MLRLELFHKLIYVGEGLLSRDTEFRGKTFGDLLGCAAIAELLPDDRPDRIETKHKAPFDIHQHRAVLANYRSDIPRNSHHRFLVNSFRWLFP